jgi:predicted PurR-regulated permease PerM
MPETKTTTGKQPLSRDRLATITLLILMATGTVLCIVIAVPFIPAITWALAIAVIAHPVHERFSRQVQRPDLAAGLAVFTITICLLAPAVFLGRQIGREATEGFDKVQTAVKSGELESQLVRNPTTAGVARLIKDNINVEQELRQFGESVQQRLGSWVRGTVWTATQFLITIFLLFYMLRDRKDAVAAVRSLLPLSNREADEVLERVRAMIHATIYGTLVVAAIQGALGGFMFWILGLPGALLWGVAMGLLAIIPVLGAFVIWVPAAIALVAQGNVAKAAILTAWGTIVVGLIDNLLYPVLVGKEMRLHTVPVFIAIVGGLFVFGASGLVLGPVVFAITLALFDVLRRRTAGNRSAQEPT